MENGSEIILTQFTYPKVIETIEAHLVAFIQFSCRISGAQCYLEEDHISAITGILQPSLNAVIHIRLSEQQLENRIAEIMSRFRAREVPMLWWLFPGTSPLTLGTHLENHGLQYNGAVPVMAIELAMLPDMPFIEYFTIEEVTTESMLNEWIQISSRAFNPEEESIDPDYTYFEHSLGWSLQSPYRRFIGRFKGEAVTTAAIFQGAGVVGLYSVGTLPAERRRGFGRAISLATLHIARTQGYHIGILQSSDKGYNVYHNIGFRECSRIPTYLWCPK
jgi:GNAT superfamily N-acetyltransferase